MNKAAGRQPNKIPEGELEMERGKRKEGKVTVYSLVPTLLSQKMYRTRKMISKTARVMRLWLKVDFMSGWLRTTMVARLPSSPTLPTRGTESFTSINLAQTSSWDI